MINPSCVVALLWWHYLWVQSQLTTILLLLTNYPVMIDVIGFHCELNKSKLLFHHIVCL